MAKNNELQVLFYDIETNLLKFFAFRCGKQVLRHSQLVKNNEFTRIITIQYCWKQNKRGKVILLDPYNPIKGLNEFDALIRQADIIIGKNNIKFDDKHINTNRLLSGLKAMPEWTHK